MRNYDVEQIALIKRTIAPTITDDELQLFVGVCGRNQMHTNRHSKEDNVEYANRGKTLERRIEKAFEQINILPSIMAIRLEVKQAKIHGKFVYCKRQPYDYLIIKHDRVYAFDAKECSAYKWYPRKAPQHQRDALQKILDMGHEAGFVVWFRNSGVVDCLRWITDFVNPATVDSGIAFDWEMFL